PEINRCGKSNLVLTKMFGTIQGKKLKTKLVGMHATLYSTELCLIYSWSSHLAAVMIETMEYGYGPINAP
ncbi:unnamed protein product, partial [Musa banksii]